MLRVDASHSLGALRLDVRLTVESVKELQESELVNNPDYGLLNNVHPSMRVQPRGPGVSRARA